MLFYIMKRDDSMVRGWRLCGTASGQRGAEAIQRAHTTFVDGKPYRVPQIWDERQYGEWLAREVTK